MLVFGGVLSTTTVIRYLDCDMSTPRYVQIFESAAGDDGTVSLSELQDEPASWYVKMPECGFICTKVYHISLYNKYSLLPQKAHLQIQQWKKQTNLKLKTTSMQS